VLDIGRGTGETFKYLRNASSVTALDVSPKMVIRAGQRARRRCHTQTVVSAGSSSTFPDYIGAFKEMARVVKAGGTDSVGGAQPVVGELSGSPSGPQRREGLRKVGMSRQP
jgi:ubiquinone/menaquinone biosynthesis C-methylase UbiE